MSRIVWEDREDALILLITFEPESNSHLHTSVHAPIKSNQSCFEFWCKSSEAFSFARIVTGSFNFLTQRSIETMKFGNAWIVVPCGRTVCSSIPISRASGTT